MNILIYFEICWIAFWCIRRTIGKERVFMVGLFGNTLLWPLRMLAPHWAFALHQIGAFGLAVALIAAFTFMLDLFNQESDVSA
jgi:hypothetical protein